MRNLQYPSWNIHPFPSSELHILDQSKILAIQFQTYSTEKLFIQIIELSKWLRLKFCTNSILNYQMQGKKTSDTLLFGSALQRLVGGSIIFADTFYRHALNGIEISFFVKAMQKYIPIGSAHRELFRVALVRSGEVWRHSADKHRMTDAKNYFNYETWK